MHPLPTFSFRNERVTAVSVTLESFLPLVYPVAMVVCAAEEGPNV